MSDEWGIGNRANDKPYGVAKMGEQTVELISGQHPHSRQDNNTYAKTTDGTIYGFSGHRLCFKIEIEEDNYLKSSYLSGDEIRKICTGKLWVNGVQVYEAGHRGYEMCYFRIQEFILKMEENWGWYPHNLAQWEGKTIGYKEQLFKITRFIVGQGCMILSTTTGLPRKRFMYEDHDEYELENTIKVELTSDGITWYPQIDINAN